jgi:hypothetical protein
MSAQDRYKKIVESLVNDETDKASELLHEAFVEKARDIWNDLLEQDEILEDEIEEQEDDLEEAIGDEEAADFLDDIEQDEDEIDAEEAFGEDEDEDDDMDMDIDDEMELATDDEPGADEMDDEGEEGVDAEFQPVQDALEDLKATFAELMGDKDEADESIEETPADEEIALEAKDDDEEEIEEEVEGLDEAAELKKVGKDNAVHPIDMPAGDDGKGSPVGPGIDDPFSSVDGAKDGKDMGPMKGNEKGGKAPTPAKMDATSPQDAGDPKPAPKPKG